MTRNAFWLWMLVAWLAMVILCMWSGGIIPHEPTELGWGE